MSAALDLVRSWPVPEVAAAVIDRGGTMRGVAGDTARAFRLASVSKLLTGWATLVAIEEGTVALDDHLGDRGVTLEHLLSHAGGYGFDGSSPITGPNTTRIYSNTGIELAAEHVAGRAEMPFGDYLAAAVFEPLGMRTAELRGSPAYAVWASVDDLVRFVGELWSPTLIAASTAADAIAVHFPGLRGMLPGIGRLDPMDWGLTFERNFGCAGHWAGPAASRSAFGHFGGSGTFLWVDPAAGVAAVALADREFDEWAMQCWPEFNSAVIAEFGTD